MKAKPFTVVAWTTFTIALATGIGGIAIIAVATISRSYTTTSRALGLAALAANAMELLTIVCLCLCARRRQSLLLPKSTLRAFACASASILTILAGSLTLAAMAASMTASATTVDSAIAVGAAGIVLAIIHLLSAAIYLYHVYSQPAQIRRIQYTGDASDSIATESELKDSPRSVKTRDASTEDQDTELVFDASRRQPRRDFSRALPQRVIHPIDSRSRLTHQPSMQSVTTTHTDAQDSIDQYHEDGFDTWQVDLDAHPLPDVPPLALIGNRIPHGSGARSVPPANPLDGPFPGTDVSSPTSSVLSLATDMPSPTLTFRPPPPRNPARTRSSESMRGSALSIRTTDEQAHIHPLFRTDNASPPPTTSPGTIVTASAWGGQRVTSPQQAWALTRPESRSRLPPESPGLQPPSSLARDPLRSVSVNSLHHPERPALRSVKSAEPATFATIRANMPPPQRTVSRQSSLAG